MTEVEMPGENLAPVQKDGDPWSLEAMTPWELRRGVWWKREDHFAPLGLGGPNGSKMRQLIHLFERHRGSAERVLTAASVLSPQHSMTAAVAHRYGLPSVHIIGGTTAEKAARHPNIRMALGFGARLEVIGVGYNPELQRTLRARRRPEDFVVPYGITTPDGASQDDIKAFHRVGGLQVLNLPESVETLIVPAGSCNSLTSIIYGLAKLGHKNLRTLVSVGIGPSKLEWTRERLEGLGVTPPLPFRWNSKVSLHESKYAAYGDRMPESHAGIDFHPTYEGKIVRWLRERGALDVAEADEGKLGFWIVAGEADEGVVARSYPKGEAGMIGQDLVDLSSGEVLADLETCEHCHEPVLCREARACAHHGADL